MLERILKAQKKVQKFVKQTPLDEFQGRNKEFVKREDLQDVRSFKVRGVANKVLMLSKEEREKGILTFSSGNNAQAVAYVANQLKIQATIFMPEGTSKEKVKRTKMFGKSNVEVIEKGSHYDITEKLGINYATKHELTIVHPFNDLEVIAGQGTIALEVLEQLNGKQLDYAFIQVGGGGLLAGVSSVLKQLSPKTKIIAVEYQGQDCLRKAVSHSKPITLNTLDRYVEGTAVARIGNLTYKICKENVDMYIVVNKPAINCAKKQSKKRNINAENAGVLGMAGLYHSCFVDLKEKNVLYIISGANGQN